MRCPLAACSFIQQQQPQDKCICVQVLVLPLLKVTNVDCSTGAPTHFDVARCMFDCSFLFSVFFCNFFVALLPFLFCMWVFGFAVCFFVVALQKSVLFAAKCFKVGPSLFGCQNFLASVFLFNFRYG